MAIEGLSREASVPTLNLADDIGVNVEALERLGLVKDLAQVAEDVASDFTKLNEAGVIGEKYIQLPKGLITLPEIILASDNGAYRSGKTYPTTYVYDELWTPGTHKNSYTEDEVGNLGLPGQQIADFPPHGRLALHNPDNPSEPLLHFLNQPFDEMYAEKGAQTQLQAIQQATNFYEAEHVDFKMMPLNASAVAFIGLTRRIKGEAMPLTWGFMRDATLPRKTLGHGSVVGVVNSYVGQLYLIMSRGDAYFFLGVGLSVGQAKKS